MITSLDPSSVSFLNGLSQIQRRSQHAQTELTTGLRINAVEDDPSQIPLLLGARAELERVQQIGSNLNQVKAEVDAGEGTLQSAVTLVERAQTLATQGQPSFMTAESRTQLAGEIGGVLQQIVSAANTTAGGRYIFSGDSDQTPPYTVDLTQPNPVSAYAGSPSTRLIEHPDGTLFPVAKTAQEIFDSSNSDQNVFQAINSLRTALLNNDQAGINAALPVLKSAGSYLNQQLTSYGVAQNRITDGLNFGQTLTSQIQTRLSAIQDADVTQAITEFQLASTQQQAALASRAKLPRSSLFDYLG